jgi:glycosyltransferase involved in cell wall biosynthesis
MAHVLHVINRFGTSGGAENQLYNNLRRFDNPRLTHSVAFVFHREMDDPLPTIPKHALFPVGASPGRIAIIRALDAHVRELRPDIIHCSLAEAALAARVVGRLRRIPVVESQVNISHDPVRTVDNPSVNSLKLAGHRLVDRVTMRWVTRFHALTEAVARSWVSNVSIPVDRITVIPRGIDMESFDPQDELERGAVRDAIGVGEHVPMLLNVARQEPQKGQRYLLEALPAIIERHPEVVVVFAGRDGNSSPHLRRLVEELELGAHVRFLGVRDDVPALLGAADVFVFPSLFEGLGVSLLEAMASGGAACAVSDAPPFDEIIDPGATGVMFRAADAADLARTVADLLSDREMQAKMSEAARQEVTGGYRIEAVTRRLEEMYLLVLDETAADGPPTPGAGGARP